MNSSGQYRAIAVIPARGGSKGIPRKNLQLVGGRALVRRSVEACLASQAISNVIVSTDDEEIAAVARSAGAEVVIRPASISGDAATSESAVVHALAQADLPSEVVVLVQPTSPFLWPEDLDALVDLTRNDFDCAFTATPTHGFIWTHEANGLTGVNHDVIPRRRRQDIPPQFLETGAAYAMRTEGFLEAGHRFFGRIGLVIVPSERSMEIDDPSDLDVARDLAARLDRRWLHDRLPSPVSAVVFDFDGVITDDRVVTNQFGTEAVVASRSDGLGIALLRESGVPLLVLSKERNPVVAARCDKLGLELVQAVDDKVEVLRTWASDNAVDLGQSVYVGNDVNDLACIELVGCGVAVGDAHPDVLRAADVVLPAPGGRGAVRSLVDAILRSGDEGSAPTRTGQRHRDPSVDVVDRAVGGSHS